MRRLSLAVILAATSATWPSAALRAQTYEFPPFFEVRVPKAPSVARGDNGAFLTYELLITNLEGETSTITKLEVLGGATDANVLLALADTALGRVLARPGFNNILTMDRARIDRGLRAVAYLWVPVDASRPATAVRHRLTITRGKGDSATTRVLETAAVPVTGQIAVIGPPLRGGPWFAANGPSNESGHRRSMLPIGGVPATAQRFAIDWVKLGDDNKTFRGDQAKNESYYAEGMDALAVADGIVVAVKDGIPENVPGVTSRAVTINLETVGGNHVILDIGDGHYAFYAHLKPGSIKVKQGERVKRGQVVGLVGNSGNSTEPHLHFHLSDSNSPLGSEGLPYALDFSIVGKCSAIFTGCERSAASPRRGEVPMGNAIVQFP
jgi:murein DD-endopeptidase MepM/ murein hydrolase activator NlpD